ncbi:hypothetical protein F895_00825 [Acinetobacter sp. CIP 64.2]|uniref:DUF2062 domain-containing protein n=1 Tax=Acinetobacter TaxID=469 RepID=UPI0002CECD9E|nr:MULTISPECIES: DUF2062 domain-containing protein [Acinetobacter]ENX17681.1 hypothetical protein F895_00825 [Acinetobacter sp. CIP 64.2]UUM27510.1 DUF2062 domain-containing protein [Acinetobacter colistiniresistens]
MPKQFFHKWLPSAEKVASLKLMKIFGERTLNPLLWYVNRRSIAKAILIGTFWGILPVPFHSVFIILTVLFFEVNLPIGLCMAWLTNPFTVVPILYLGFWFGTKIYHVNMINKDMLLGVLHQILNWIKNFGHGHIDFSLAKILVSGLIIEAILFAILFYLATLLLWRWIVIRSWRNRRKHQREEII